MEVSFWYSGMCQQCTICLKCFFLAAGVSVLASGKTPTISVARARNVMIPKITVMVAFLSVSLTRLDLHR
jgi:hypothetical protein